MQEPNLTHLSQEAGAEESQGVSITADNHLHWFGKLAIWNIFKDARLSNGVAEVRSEEDLKTLPSRIIEHYGISAVALIMLGDS